MQSVITHVKHLARWLSWRKAQLLLAIITIFFVIIELQTPEAIFTTFSWVETFDKGRESVSGKENSTTQTLEMIGHLGQVQIVKFGWNLEQIGRLIVGISLPNIWIIISNQKDISSKKNMKKYGTLI